MVEKQDNVKSEPKRSRTRSPAYPNFGLEESIRKAEVVWKKEDRHFANVEAVAADWGYGATSSAGPVAISALKQYGLLVDEGSKDTRRVKLSNLALDILTNEERSPKRDEAIKLSALNPKIHRELWDKYRGNLPPTDRSIRLYLIREREDGLFNKDRVDSFISQFRSTISFAKLDQSGTMVDGIDEKEGNNQTATIQRRQVHEGETMNPNQLGQGESLAERSPRPILRQGGVKEDTCTLGEGLVVLQWPERLSPESFEDFESWLQLIIRKAKRSIQSDLPAK
jgi:hypothetical protein